MGGYSSAGVQGHRHAVPASVYSGTAGTARAPYRPISSSGPGSSMQGIDAGRDRLRDMLGVPRSGTGPGTSPASTSSVQQPTAQSQSRSVASTQQPVGLAVR